MKYQKQFGPWQLEYMPTDGGRISRLKYGDIDLLTVEPENFTPPKEDYGLYETRPVYGYDDCFPSVDACVYPGKDWEVPDHGEICWFAWQVEKESNRLIFTTKSKMIPLIFKRILSFDKKELTWDFEVINDGKEHLPFQHVMHPLMPLSEITDIRLPLFNKVFDEIDQQKLDLTSPDAVSKFLFSQPPGSANMLFLQDIETGEMGWTYKNGLEIKVFFQADKFPSIGIWWNHSGYPDENGCRRNECAFEPIPGFNSILADAYKQKKCLFVKPGERFSWQILWKLEKV